jgi:Tol biopolymer transport system component
MKPWILFVGLLLSSVCVLTINAHHGEFPLLEGPYLGQKPPGMTPEVFAPGFVSTDAPEGCICFSYDGRYVVFRRHFREQTEVYISEYVEGTWTKPTRAPFFMKEYRFGDFTFSPNELKLYFTSNRPLNESKEPAESSNLWVVEKTSSHWLKPTPLGTSVNSPQHDSYPAVSNDRTLYFFRRYDSENGASEILTSELENGAYTAPKKLGATINTEWDEWDPCISPDGKILVFCSKKPGGLGEDDLYVSFKDKNGGWVEATNLGSTVNSSGSENRPFITADGMYLFYTSNEGGNRDVYWVDMEIVRRLKPAQ